MPCHCTKVSSPLPWDQYNRSWDSNPINRKFPLGLTQYGAWMAVKLCQYGSLRICSTSPPPEKPFAPNSCKMVQWHSICSDSKSTGDFHHMGHEMWEHSSIEGPSSRISSREWEWMVHESTLATSYHIYLVMCTIPLNANQQEFSPPARLQPYDGSSDRP